MNPDQITRFQFLFRGNSQRHYVRRDSGDPNAIPRGITADDVARHLAGKRPSLLSVPTNSLGLSHFALIDVDRHHNPSPVDWPALARRIAELQLPLIVSKSTGGKGAWLMLFLKEPEGFSSALVRQILSDYAARLKIPDSEIFPKQDRTDNYGSGVNLPYFGDQRPAFDRDGNQLSLDEFLRYAEQRAVWGAILSIRERPARAPKSSDEFSPITIQHARETFDGLLKEAAGAKHGQRHDLIHRATWYAARATRAGVFDEASVKQRILAVARSLFPRQELRKRFAALRRSWQAGLAAGALTLDLYPEDLDVLRNPMIADDIAFWRTFYGNTVDFPSSAEAKKYMKQQLVAAGSKHVDRILKAADIDDAVAAELLLELQLQQLLENSASGSSE
jgi:hypothetical protein